ncbi:hypothetical protein RSP673_005915 [Ralstonia solanacearum P673]|uniref:hypothetical protein n=1 Tax=Ralstonia solanacearum TaxID=305 RepID=UPI00126848CD|nr:hypothetical protein [Ralstonia solanacearum]MCL9851992.1 hypothetical protein [Ralstonia solanacearum]MCL9856952.1 hypothetical protein [Ralstonia solanacearum]MCL9858581.1 hypothetical protein [Ralstonia solanacearum]MCL9866543.1 hypothetical protein [Ralstonia solanacearum]MCL9871329.1 hypothetical protein [Ralstonia solanacearum]
MVTEKVKRPEGVLLSSLSVSEEAEHESRDKLLLDRIMLACPSRVVMVMGRCIAICRVAVNLNPPKEGGAWSSPPYWLLLDHGHANLITCKLVVWTLASSANTGGACQYMTVLVNTPSRVKLRAVEG